jgi:hypothetical protein
MGDIKSAREIALEKVEKVGELNAGEKAKLKQERLELFARGLVDKYIKCSDARLFNIEIGKYDCEDQEFIRLAAAKQLVSLMTLENISELDMLILGISSLNNDIEVLTLLDRVRNIKDTYSMEYNRAKGKTYDRGKNVLTNMGISGTAISMVNFDVVPGAGDNLNTIKTKFTKQLADLKNELVEKLV